MIFSLHFTDRYVILYIVKLRGYRINDITTQLIIEAADSMFPGAGEKRNRLSLFDDLLVEMKMKKKKTTEQELIEQLRKNLKEVEKRKKRKNK